MVGGFASSALASFNGTARVCTNCGYGLCWVRAVLGWLGLGLGGRHSTMTMKLNHDDNRKGYMVSLYDNDGNHVASRICMTAQVTTMAMPV